MMVKVQETLLGDNFGPCMYNDGEYVNIGLWIWDGFAVSNKISICIWDFVLVIPCGMWSFSCSVVLVILVKINALYRK